MKLHTKAQAPKEGKAAEPKDQKPVGGWVCRTSPDWHPPLCCGAWKGCCRLPASSARGACSPALASTHRRHRRAPLRNCGSA